MSEYKPTEYVLDFGDSKSNQFVLMNIALIEQNGAKLGEKIVRCRDCERFDDKWAYCNYFMEDVEPNGFCAWGVSNENTLPQTQNT